MMNINSTADMQYWSHCWVFISMHNFSICWEEIMSLERSLNIKSNAAQLIHKKAQTCTVYKYLYRMNALMNWTIILWCIFLYVPHCYGTECQWGEILLCSAFTLYNRFQSVWQPLDLLNKAAEQCISRYQLCSKTDSDISLAFFAQSDI